MDTVQKHPVPDRVKPSFVIFLHSGTLTLSPEHQSARMSKITNDGLTRSGTGCFIPVSIWQQWASKCTIAPPLGVGYQHTPVMARAILYIMCYPVYHLRSSERWSCRVLPRSSLLCYGSFIAVWVMDIIIMSTVRDNTLRWPQHTEVIDGVSTCKVGLRVIILEMKRCRVDRVSRFLTAHQHNYRLYSAIHVGMSWKIQDRRQIKNRHTTKTKHNPEKQTTQNTAKQFYPGSVVFYDTRPGNEVGLFYNAPELTRGMPRWSRS